MEEKGVVIQCLLCRIWGSCPSWPLWSKLLPDGECPVWKAARRKWCSFPSCQSCGSSWGTGWSGREWSTPVPTFSKRASYCFNLEGQGQCIIKWMIIQFLNFFNEWTTIVLIAHKWQSWSAGGGRGGGIDTSQWGSYQNYSVHICWRGLGTDGVISLESHVSVNVIFFCGMYNDYYYLARTFLYTICILCYGWTSNSGIIAE